MSSADDILSTKPTLMSNPGYKMNSLYPSKANSSVDLLEATAFYQNVISLNSLQFGGSSQVLLPIDQFVSHVILRVRLPNLLPNQSIPRGWCYQLLQQVGFTLGASSSVSTILTTDSILMTLMAQCENAEMRDEILRLGGEEQLGPAVAPLGEIVPWIEGYCIIPLPFSALCNDTFPLDTTMLSNNINLQFVFNQASAIYGGSAVKPTQMLAAELTLHQLKLSDQSSSLRNAMIQSPGLVLNMPTILHQAFSTPSFAGHRDGDPGVPCQVLLQAFGAGDLLGIHFWVIADEFKSPSASSTPNPWVLDDISDIQIEFNGSQIYRMNGKQYKLANMLGNAKGAGYYDASYVAPGAVQPFVSQPKKCYPIFVDFSRLRAACTPEHQWNVWRLANQNLILRFNTSKDQNTSYRVYATYHYNCNVALVDGISSLLV